MRAFRPGCVRASPHPGAVVALAVAGLCGMLAAAEAAQRGEASADIAETSVAEPVDPSGPAAAPETGAVSGPSPPAAPLKVLSWNVASSPYAIAMRKIKSAVPSWRTSFGSERRTIEVPTAPQAADIDADVVLLQGITTPRALRRLFPARKWRLIFSRRALESLPKGSVFTAPVSSVEIEAVAVRFRQGLRVIALVEQLDAAHMEHGAEHGAGGASDVASQNPSPGLAVKVLDRGKPLWLASISAGAGCAPTGACERLAALMRWREARAKSGEATVAGGRLYAGQEAMPCDKQAIEIGSPAGPEQSVPGNGQHRPLFGCVAELTVP